MTVAARKRNARATGDATRPTVMWLIGRLDQGVRREHQRFLAPHNLAVPEFTAMAVLQRQPGLSNAQLARRTFITPQSMNEVIAALERRGLIERRIDPSHGRILQTRLTPAGRGMLRRVDPSHEALEADLLQDIPEAEREIVRRGLVAMIQRLEQRARAANAGP